MGSRVEVVAVVELEDRYGLFTLWKRCEVCGSLSNESRMTCRDCHAPFLKLGKTKDPAPK